MSGVMHLRTNGSPDLPVLCNLDARDLNIAPAHGLVREMREESKATLPKCFLVQKPLGECCLMIRTRASRESCTQVWLSDERFDLR